ncbi:MAG TPA: LPS export ABC transporter periplasmic protein LptC [Syntrophales bacterium]|nr:LPS export ABC transporter periplasmic protein LptC [Syntrophales bacterium]
MKLKRSYVVAAIVIAAIVLSGAVVLYVERARSAKNQLLNIVSDKVDLEVRDVNYTDVGASGMKWEIKADSAKYLKNENLIVFDKIKVKLVMPDGRTLFLTGDKGKSNTETRDMEVSGNVEILSDKGDKLTTDVLKYSGAEQRMYTHSAVKLENSRMQVNGVGMSFSLEEKTVALLSKVRAIIKK